MKAEIRKELNDIVKHGAFVLIATSDPEGKTHVGAAGSFNCLDNGKLEVSQWFCPGTMANLTFNPNVTIVIWNKEQNKGFQFIGELEDVIDTAMADGYGKGIAEENFPQAYKKLIMKIEKVLEFKLGPHDDTPMKMIIEEPSMRS